MNKYKIIITPTAIDNIKSIAAYIANVLCNYIAANNFLNRIKTKIKELEVFPYSHQLVGNKKIKELRKQKYKAFIIYFVIDDLKMEVQVLAVIYGKKDQLSKINKLDF